MPGVTQEQIAAARRMSTIEFLQKYRPNSLVKSSARGEYQLAEHDSFKINGESSVWHWKSRDIGGKSALKYLIYVEGVPFVEAVQLLCEESPMYILNCTPFVRQYGILFRKWGVFVCQKEYQTNDIRRNSRKWL